MATDLEAVVWSGIGLRPAKMGSLYLTQEDCRFTYSEDFLNTGSPGIGIIYPPEIIQRTTIVRKRTEFFDFLPPVQALIPPRNQRNFQRQLILNYLAKKGVVPVKGFEADWAILMLAGHGGIGHLDVFESDDAAKDWYRYPQKTILHELNGELGFSLKEFITWFSADNEALIQLIGPTPSVGGAIPKLLVSIPQSGWDGRIALPARTGTSGLTDVILKFEQSANYPGIIELEALALDLHEEAGFSVPRRWMTNINDIPTLVVERFDRDKNGSPVATESLYSIMASGDRKVTTNYSSSYDAIVQAIEFSPIELVSDKKEAKLHLLKRLLFSLATGNGDLHMENLSLVKTKDVVSFSPIYDPTPMRAYSKHNLLTVMPFGGYGEAHLAEALVRFSKKLGFRKNYLKDLIEEVLARTLNYASKIQELGNLPQVNKEYLVRITDSMASELKKIK